MAKCLVCGKHGLFLRVNSSGKCAECEAKQNAAPTNIGSTGPQITINFASNRRVEDEEMQRWRAISEFENKNRALREKHDTLCRSISMAIEAGSTDTAIKLCYQDIDLAPRLVEYWTHLKAMPGSYLTERPRITAFSSLARLLTETGRANEALEVLRKGISIGADGDSIYGGLPVQLAQLQWRIETNHVDSFSFTKLRSALGKSRRSMFTVEGSPDLYKASEEKFMAAIWLAYYIGTRVDKLSEAAADIATLFPDPKRKYDELRVRGWLNPPNCSTILSACTLQQLKDLALNCGLSEIKGRKTDLVSVLCDMDSPTLDGFIAANEVVDASPLGLRVLRSLYNERVSVEREIGNLLLIGDDSAAIERVKAYMCRRPVYGIQICHWVLKDTPREDLGFCIVLASRLMGTECITSQFKEYENKYSHEK